MTECDAFDLPLTVARRHSVVLYNDSIEAFLAADPSVERRLDTLLIDDPDCALARIARARFLQSVGRGAEARAEAQQAQALAAGLTDRERGHVDALASAVRGEGRTTLARITAHLDRFPADLFVLAPVAGVFGLFGFSGEAGREERLFQYLEARRSTHEDHWWFKASLAFALCETGRLDQASALIEEAWSLHPESANTAHIRAHIDYERADDARTLNWLEPWFESYDRSGAMHCHLGWHLALARLRLGAFDSADEAYQRWVRAIDPETGQGAWGPPLNRVTDASSWLFRAQLRGLPVSSQTWQRVLSDARTAFPAPGVRFADVHLALCLAMAGDLDALEQWLAAIDGPVAPVIHRAASGFKAIAQSRWDQAASALLQTLDAHEVLGGSRAQRDLLVEAWSFADSGGQALMGRVPRTPSDAAALP